MFSLFLLISGCTQDDPEEVSLVETPDRFTEVIPEPGESRPAPELLDEDDSPELDEQDSHPPPLMMEQAKEVLDAEADGVPKDFSTGLIGTKGTQTGSGGLGSSGSGLGGGGTPEGLGGLGTKGRGTGVSGYGSGSGSFGSKSSNYSPPPSEVGSWDEPPDVYTEHYTNYGVNSLTLVADDALSTFAVDVDTASYSICRAKLNGGVLPPQSAVRVEEFVNSFDYGYTAPGSSSDAPFAVYMEAAPHPWDPGKHLMRVGLQGKEFVGERQPLRLTFLVDVSGSMSSVKKLDLAKRSLHFLVNNLGEEDSVALVTYAGTETVVLPATSLLHDERIHDAIDQLRSGGGTSMGSGMELAYAEASSHYLPGAENRVIVISDGDANIGRNLTWDTILEGIQQHAEEGITMTTVGVGMGNYQDTMMEQLSNNGDGNYFYIDSFEEAKKVFGEDLSGTIQTIAKDVKIQVEWNAEAVSAYRLVGYENRDIADDDFRDDSVDAGEVGSGHSVTALYELVLRDDVRSQELATVRVRAKKPGPDSPAREWLTTFDGAELHSELADASSSFELTVAVAFFAELLRGSQYVNELSYGEVLALAEGAAPQETELHGLIRLAADYAGRGSELAGAL